MSPQKSVLIVVPCYNAAAYLPDLIERLKKVACESNTLFINDGSSDATARILKESNTIHISYKINRGKGAALMLGFKYAADHGYRSVLTIDADLQHLPEEIPAFYAADNGHRVVLGTRKIELKRMPFQRWLTNNLTSLIISIFATQRIRDSQCGYRLMPTDFLGRIKLNSTGYDLESEMLFAIGLDGCRVVETPISTIYEGSPSFINPWKVTAKFVKEIWRRIWA